MEAPVLIETITIPLRTETKLPGSNEDNTGFPFDDSDIEEGNRDRSFRSHLDDLAKRHPEFAEHLTFDNNFDRFPFRNNTWGHKRRGAPRTDSRASGSAEYPESARFATGGRPFGPRVNEYFAFPFNSKSFNAEPEYYEEPSSKNQTAEQGQGEQQEKPQQQQEEKPPQVPKAERGRKQNPNIPQSSTVDLGQKQEPVYDSRSQRSMSAPPENRAGQQRYVSSINIPINSDGMSEPNSHHQQQQQPQPQPQQQAPQNKTHERVIPIHVEGRDEPVIPKNVNQTYTQPPPQSERIFGQRPAGFGQWNRGEPQYYAEDPQFYHPTDSTFFTNEPKYFEGGQQFFKRAEPQHQRSGTPTSGIFRQAQRQPQTSPHPQQRQQTPPPQQHQYQQQQQQPQPQPQPQQQHQHHQQQQQQQPQPPPPPEPEQQHQPPTSQPSAKLGPIEQIQCIQKDVLELMTEVEKFNGKPKDKQYLFLDEMLTRNLLKLDDVETEGKETIRLARKEAINCIQRCISILEAKANANELLQNQLMDVDAKLETTPASSVPSASQEEAPLTSLQVSGVSRSGSQTTTEGQSTENETPMDVGSSVDTSVKDAPAPDKQLEAELSNETNEKNVEVPSEVNAIKEGSGEVTKEAQIVEGSNDSQKASEEASNTNEQPEEKQQTKKEEVKDKKDKKKVKKKEKAEN